MKAPNTQPAYIRAFFAAFAEGVLSVAAEADKGEVELTPQRVKRLMLDHYEEISKHFFDILFNPLALLHYATAEELIAVLRSPEVAPTLTSPVDLFRYVCRTTEAHDDMVAEYRRNFTALLTGHVLSTEEFYDGFPKGYLCDVDEPSPREVRSLTQIVVNAFFAGVKVTKAANVSGTNQVYLFRLLLDNMQCLLHAGSVHLNDDIDLPTAFMTVCRNEENMNVMLQTMQECLKDIASHE